MGRLLDQIKAAVLADRWVFSNHADDMLRERGIVAWQVVAGVESGRLLVERDRDQPNPVVEVQQELADGTSVKVVWAWMSGVRVAKVVTVHFFDR